MWAAFEHVLALTWLLVLRFELAVPLLPVMKKQSTPPAAAELLVWPAFPRGPWFPGPMWLGRGPPLMPAVIHPNLDQYVGSPDSCNRHVRPDRCGLRTTSASAWSSLACRGPQQQGPDVCSRCRCISAHSLEWRLGFRSFARVVKAASTWFPRARSQAQESTTRRLGQERSCYTAPWSGEEPKPAQPNLQLLFVVRFIRKR